MKTFAELIRIISVLCFLAGIVCVIFESYYLSLFLLAVTVTLIFTYCRITRPRKFKRYKVSAEVKVGAAHYTELIVIDAPNRSLARSGAIEVLSHCDQIIKLKIGR